MGTILHVLLSTVHVKTQPGLTEKMAGQSERIPRGMLHQWPHGKETAFSSTRQKHAPTLPPVAVKLPENACSGNSIPGHQGNTVMQCRKSVPTPATCLGHGGFTWPTSLLCSGQPLWTI